MTTPPKNSMTKNAQCIVKRPCTTSVSSNPPPGENAGKQPSTLEILIVHEDMPAGLRAKRALDRLGGESGMKLHFVVKLWTFRVLAEPLLYEYAINDASDASILFLSLHGQRELPHAVCELINNWMANQAEQPKALVVSFDENFRESATAKGVLDYLRNKSIAGGVDLFPHFGATPATASNWGSHSSPPKR